MSQQHTTHGNIIIKVKYAKPDAGKGRSAGDHAHYIGTRPGTDMSRTESDIASDLEHEKALGADADNYAAYMGRRKGVAVDEGVNHGLFDKYGTADMHEVCKELRELKNTPALKLIVSLREEDAASMAITTKEDWEILLRKTMPEVGMTLDLPPSRLGWVAAYHPKERHPHVHLVVWDKADQPKHGYRALNRKELHALKQTIARNVFSEERELLYSIKNTERDNIRQMAMEDVAAAMGKKEVPLADGVQRPVKLREVWLQNELMRIADLMPGRGRAAYKLMPPEVKAAVDGVVDRLLASPRFSVQAKRYIDAHEAIARNYIDRQELAGAVREKALDELRERMNNVVLRGAKDMQDAAARDVIMSEREAVREMLLPATDSVELDAAVRVKLDAGADREAVIDEIADRLGGEDRQSAQEQAEDIVSHASVTPASVEDWEVVQQMPGYVEAHDLMVNAAAMGEAEFAIAQGMGPTPNGNVHDDIAKGIVGLSKAAAKGNDVAQYKLATFYRDGLNVGQDAGRAVNLFVAAASQGNQYAQYALANLYLAGVDVPKDINKALTFYIMAAEQGNSYAQYRLGRLYLAGVDLPKDIGKGIRYLTMAAGQGNQYAQYQLGKAMLMGKDVPKDREAAMAWLMRSAQQGNVYSQRMIDNDKAQHSAHAFNALNHTLQALTAAGRRTNYSDREAFLQRLLKGRILDGKKVVGELSEAEKKARSAGQGR